MKSILRATTILGSSSIVTILVGLVSAKAWALLLGPSGLGTMGLLQSLVGLAGLVTGMGVGTGLVRMGANALERGDDHHLAALRWAIWLLFWSLGVCAVVVLAIFRVPISVAMLGGPEQSASVVLMGFALLFSLAAGLQTSLLNAYHRVGALAKLAIFNSLLGTAVSLALVWFWREQGIAPAIIAGTTVNYCVSGYFLRREVGAAISRPTRREVAGAAWSLLRFGAPYTASLLVGTGVQLAMPALISHTLGIEGVGFYRAAVAISVNYLGFLLLAMGQDYYPRVSAASDRPAELAHLVNQQHRLVMLLGVPIILGALALAPYLVPLIYSRQFLPTVDILEWQLIGDLFKFSSWTMGFIMLARSRSVAFFFAELSFGLSTLVSSWLGMRWFGLAGLGIGFLTAYVVLYLVNWMIVRREIGLIWTKGNKHMMLVALLAALVIRVLPLAGLEGLRTPVALSFALLAAFGSLYVIWQELGGAQYVRARRN
jgi:O-antigen/teichoic acid export membrane protein